MGWKERELQPDKSPRHFYGSEIRRLRKLHDNMSLGRLAKILNFSLGHLSRIEGGDSKPPEGLSEKLDTAFNTDGSFQRYYALAKREPFPDKYSTYLKLANTAIGHASYTLTVPGLLQSEAFASAVLNAGEPLATPEELEDWLTTRMARQTRLHQDPPPCRYWFIVDEWALRRPVGGAAVMVEQLSLLLAACQLRHVTVQVLPFSAGVHSEMGGTSLILLTLPDQEVIAYEEGSRSGHLIEDAHAVAQRRDLYDLLRAQSLSPHDTEAVIRSALEGFANALRGTARPLADE
ncbi:Scr1 family TA system antitoxin-like transcriptional regulator [Kitasatospora sp. NPDC058046]|uniref:helix-turn-helix domain-containing protein n=1 Tax=Kitasatospora sp. NPDC058046 TaxID=3346312 RepID=UPI0036DEAE0C